MRGIVVAGLVAAALGGCTRARTELVVGLITNLSATDQVDTVTLTGEANGHMPVNQTWMISGLPNMPAELPGSFGVYTSDGSEPSVTLVATGWSSGVPIVKRKAVLTLVGEKTLFMRMGLVDVCQNDSCGPDETCIEGACKPAAIDARKLPIYLRGMEQGITCPGTGILYRNTSTKQLVPIAGGGDCQADEECVEGTCLKTVVPGEDMAGVVTAPDLSMSQDMSVAADLSMPPDLWMPGLSCAAPVVSTLAGNGAANYADGSGGAGGGASFHDPTAVALGAGGVLYVSDATNHRLRAVAPDGTTTTLAGNGIGTQTDGTGGALGTASFLAPRGLAFDGTKTLYVADGNLIRQVDTSSGAVSLLAGDVTGGGYMEGTGNSAKFQSPSGLTWEPTCGCLYVADSGNHVIRTLTPAGVSQHLAGLPQSAGYTDGDNSMAQFSSPSGVAANATSVWVADLNNHILRTIALGATPMISTLSGNHTPGYMEGAPATAQFNFPNGIVLGPAGTLYVADSGNDRIRAVDTASGNTSLLAGSGTPSFSDGVATGAGFYDPAGLAYDGGLFVADQLNQRIRRVVCP